MKKTKHTIYEVVVANDLEAKAYVDENGEFPKDKVDGCDFIFREFESKELAETYTEGINDTRNFDNHPSWNIQPKEIEL